MTSAVGSVAHGKVDCVVVTVETCEVGCVGTVKRVQADG